MAYRRKPNRKPYLLVGIVLIVALGLAGYFLVKHDLGGRADGSTSKIIDTTATAEPTFNDKLITIKNAWFSFSYPAALQPLPSNPTDKNDPVNYLFKYHVNQTTWIVAVALEYLPTADIKNDSGYLMRSQNPQKFQLSSLKVDGKSYLVFSDISQPGFNKVAYSSLNRNLLGIVSITNSDDLNDQWLQQTFNQILGSWTWL